MISKFNIIDLPDVIYTIIQSYISNYDYRCFMNTSKAGFALIKRKTIYSSLYIHASKYYCIDREYREDILQTVLHPERQISIYFKHYREIKEALEEEVVTSPSSSHERSEKNDNNENDDEIPMTQSQSSSSVSTSENEITLANNGAVSSFSSLILNDQNMKQEKEKDKDKDKEDHLIILPIHQLRIHEKITVNTEIIQFIKTHFITKKIIAHRSNLTSIPFIPFLEHINIPAQHLTDITHLSHLNSVSLHNCLELSDIESLKNVRDIVLFDCPHITNFSCLGRQHSLEISHCPGLKDLTTFSFIRRIEIVACPGIINLHALKDIYDLTLDLCWERHSLTGLTSHHYRLKLMNVSENTSGYEILYQVPHVSLETSFIHDLQVLSEAKSISLERCYKVNDVSPLINVKEIRLNECSKITNISSLQGIERLTIGYLPSLSSYEGLGNHIHVSIMKGRNLFNDFSYMMNTRHLTLSNIHYIQSIIDTEEGKYRDALKNLTSLHISECNQLSHVRGLGDIHTVVIEKCHGLGDISGLGRNHTVHLIDCSKVTDVSSLKTVQVVRLLECRYVKNANELKVGVPRLLISYYDRD